MDVWAQRLVDGLTYAVFQIPALLVAMGYRVKCCGSKLDLRFLNDWLSNDIGIVAAVCVLVIVGAFFARVVQVGFRSM